MIIHSLTSYFDVLSEF